MAGYIIGTEWWPLSVNVTNFAHNAPPSWYQEHYNPQYNYFHPHEKANAFEIWVTYIVDLVAQLETSYLAFLCITY